jgi:hypothetical protein
MVKLIDFFCQISSLEGKLEDALNRCETLQENIKDKVILDDLKSIEYRVDYARYKMTEIRNRGRDLFTYEEGKGL